MNNTRSNELDSTHIPPEVRTGSFDSPERIDVLGVGISAVNMTATLDHILAAIEKDERRYLCVTPVHSVMDCQDDPTLLRLFNQSYLTVPDGMPLVWALKAAGFMDSDRVYGPELMRLALENYVANGVRHYLYGGAPGIAERVATRARSVDPECAIVGSASPPYRDLTEEETESYINEMNQSGAQIIWVALGAPKQERWIAKNRDRIEAPIMIGVGVAFNYLAGTTRQAPIWMRNAGLEWFFRLITEPQNVWPRYIRYPKFVLLYIAQLIRRRGITKL